MYWLKILKSWFNQTLWSTRSMHLVVSKEDKKWALNSVSFCLQWLRVCYTLPPLYHQREWSESRRNKVSLLVLLLARSTGWRVGSFRSTPCLHPPFPCLVPVPTVAGLERFDLVLDANCLLSVPWFSYRENTNYSDVAIVKTQTMCLLIETENR